MVYANSITKIVISVKITEIIPPWAPKIGTKRIFPDIFTIAATTIETTYGLSFLFGINTCVRSILPST